jgi:hypothetical protein
MRKRTGKNLSDLEAALAEYAQQQVDDHGRALPDVVAELVRGGCKDLTLERLKGWMAVAGRVVVEEDPLENERDEARRAEKLEARLAEAAESIPGAADLLGLDRLRAAVVVSADLDGKESDMAAVLVRALDFLVPELMAEALVLQETAVCIPRGGRWEVWDGGVRQVLASTLAIFNEEGRLVALRLRTRPRGRLKLLKGSQMLPVRTARLVLKADLRAVAQRLVQVAAEFRSGRHGRVTQQELAQACGRTKQAISNQLRLVTNKVRLASGGRGGFRGVRNLRPKRGVGK